MFASLCTLLPTRWAMCCERDLSSVVVFSIPSVFIICSLQLIPMFRPTNVSSICWDLTRSFSTLLCDLYTGSAKYTWLGLDSHFGLVYLYLCLVALPYSMYPSCLLYVHCLHCPAARPFGLLIKSRRIRRLASTSPCFHFV